MREFIIPVKDNLKIQSWLKSDTQELFDLVDANREMLQQWLIWVPLTKSKTDIEEFIDKSQKEYSKKNGMQMGLWDQENLIGTIGLNNIDLVNNKASIGYWLSSDYQGKGAMAKAVKSLMAYGFDTLNLNKIELKIAKKNSKSKSIAERLGFQKEGLLRQDEYLNNEYYDYIIYSFLHEDWN
jgi:ribosomal-protein-serine acetyltransferase